MKTKLQYSKSTKRTHVYATADENAPVKTIYVQNEHLPKKPPKEISITIDFEDEE